VTARHEAAVQQFLAHGDALDPALENTPQGRHNRAARSCGARLCVQFDGGEPALGRLLLDRVNEQLAQAHAACSLGDRAPAEYLGNLCRLAWVGVRRGARDGKPPSPDGNPVEQDEEIVGRYVEVVVPGFACTDRSSTKTCGFEWPSPCTQLPCSLVHAKAPAAM
jgi:hypothetical protein